MVYMNASTYALESLLAVTALRALGLLLEVMDLNLATCRRDKEIHQCL